MAARDAQIALGHGGPYSVQVRLTTQMLAAIQNGKTSNRTQPTIQMDPAGKAVSRIYITSKHYFKHHTNTIFHEYKSLIIIFPPPQNTSPGYFR